MFAEFEQGAQKKDCESAGCSNSKYLLQARHYIVSQYTTYSIEGEVIVTEMKRFYQNIGIFDDNNALTLDGKVFSGVQFKDHEGQTVKSRKENFKKKTKINYETFKREFFWESISI